MESGHEPRASSRTIMHVFEVFIQADWDQSSNSCSWGCVRFDQPSYRRVEGHARSSGIKVSEVGYK